MLIRSNKSETNIISTAIGAFFIIILFEWLWPDVIPFTTFQFWKIQGSLWEALLISWPIFLWGGAFTIVKTLITRNSREVNRHAELILGGGCLISILAGTMEEPIFRWLIFYNEIIVYKILNWLLFGWAGFGVFEWLFLNVTGPLANYITLGYVHPLLFNGFGWAVGAAILSSTGKFRNEHAYLGIIGWINSWFLGMFFFWLMFQYGLIAGIIVHFIYDMIIFTVAYIDAAIERALGW